MKYSALVGISLVVAGCEPTDNIERVLVPTTERAEVYDVAYMPASHGTGTSFNYNDWSVSTHDVSTPATYAVVFKCQHGKFIIEGDRGESLYKKLEKGEQVTISYTEEWLVNHTKTNRQFVALHFVDANPMEK